MNTIKRTLFAVFALVAVGLGLDIQSFPGCSSCPKKECCDIKERAPQEREYVRYDVTHTTTKVPTKTICRMEEVCREEIGEPEVCETTSKVCNKQISKCNTCRKSPCGCKSVKGRRYNKKSEQE